MIMIKTLNFSYMLFQIKSAALKMPEEQLISPTQLTTIDIRLRIYAKTLPLQYKNVLQSRFLKHTQIFYQQEIREIQSAIDFSLPIFGGIMHIMSLDPGAIHLQSDYFFLVKDFIRRIPNKLCTIFIISSIIQLTLSMIKIKIKILKGQKFFY